MMVTIRARTIQLTERRAATRKVPRRFTAIITPGPIFHHAAGKSFQRFVRRPSRDGWEKPRFTSLGGRSLRAGRLRGRGEGLPLRVTRPGLPVRLGRRKQALLRALARRRVRYIQPWDKRLRTRPGSGPLGQRRPSARNSCRVNLVTSFRPIFSRVRPLDSQSTPLTTEASRMRAEMTGVSTPARVARCR